MRIVWILHPQSFEFRVSPIRSQSFNGKTEVVEGGYVQSRNTMESPRVQIPNIGWTNGGEVQVDNYLRGFLDERSSLR